jgi:hypothetical protein
MSVVVDAGRRWLLLITDDRGRVAGLRQRPQPALRGAAGHGPGDVGACLREHVLDDSALLLCECGQPVDLGPAQGAEVRIPEGQGDDRVLLGCGDEVLVPGLQALALVLFGFDLGGAGIVVVVRDRRLRCLGPLIAGFLGVLGLLAIGGRFGDRGFEGGDDSGVDGQSEFLVLRAACGSAPAHRLRRWPRRADRGR